MHILHLVGGASAGQEMFVVTRNPETLLSLQAQAQPAIRERVE